MNSDQAEDLFDNIKDVVDEAFGEGKSFLIIIPHNQQMATNIDPSGIPPILSSILYALLNGAAKMVEHVEETGEIIQGMQKEFKN